MNLVPGQATYGRRASVEGVPESTRGESHKGGRDARLPAPSLPMTAAQHAQQKAWVLAAELLAPTRAQRHGVYLKRKPVIVVKPAHHYVLPVVQERLI